MASTQQILFDATKVNGRVQILVDLDGVDPETLDTRTFASYIAATNDQLVQIERVRWVQSVSSGIIKLEWFNDTTTGGSTDPGGGVGDGTSDSSLLIMNLFGSGHWYHDLSIKVPSGYASTSFHGSIIVTPTVSATLLIDLRKTQGYTGRSDQSN